jgi:hypothetical protein
MKLLREYISPGNDMEVIVEQSSCTKPKNVRLKGPYIMTEIKNNNGRIYSQSLMEKCVDEFNTSMIMTNRALGELNHPEGVVIDYNNVCHRITNLKQDKNMWIGESIILTGTPKGDIIASLLYHGTRVGMSTRGVGTITEGNRVDKEYKIITVDLVSDPSIGCFVDTVNESKDYMIDKYGDIVEMAYDALKKVVDKVSSNDSEKNRIVLEALKQFINSI